MIGVATKSQVAENKLKSNMNKELRNFIISILDDENGISEKSFDILNKLAEQDQSLHDIVLATDVYDNRFFLNEEDANDLRNKK